MSFPLQTTVNSICSSLSGPIIIDCQKVPEYKKKIIISLENNADNEIFHVSLNNGQIVCMDVNTGETLSVQAVLKKRNIIRPELFFIITSDYKEISTFEKIFRDRSSLGRLKPTLFIRDKVESYYLPLIDSVSRYENASISSFEDFLETHCQSFPNDQIESLHKVITYCRHIGLQWNRKITIPIDELILVKFQSIAETWKELGQVFNINFSGMPFFSTITSDRYFSEFLEGIESFFGHPYSIISTINSKLNLGIKNDYTRILDPNKIEFRISRLNELPLTPTERSKNRNFKFSDYLKLVVEDELQGDLKSCVENVKNLTNKATFKIRNRDNEAISFSHVVVQFVGRVKRTKKGYSNNDGICQINGLVEGDYTVSVTKSGYKNKTLDIKIKNRNITKTIRLSSYVPPRPKPHARVVQSSAPPTEKYKISIVDRRKILVSTSDHQITIRTDLAQLPSGAIEINSLTHHGSTLLLESKIIENTYPSKLLYGNPKEILSNNETITGLLVDIKKGRYAWRIQKIDEYFTDTSELTNFIGARMRLIDSEEDEDSLISTYWEEYNNHLVSIDDDLVKKMIWLDVSSVSQCILPTKFKITITDDTTQITDVKNIDYMTLDECGNLSLSCLDAVKQDIALMHVTHPCKQFAINKGHNRLTGLPIVICDERSELYNYRGGKPSLFIKSSSDLTPDATKEYWNVIEQVQHMTIGSTKGELASLPGRLLTMIESGYLEKRNPSFSSGEFRLISFGSGRGDVEKKIMNEILTKPDHKIDSGTVCLVDEADQILGKAFNTIDSRLRRRIDLLFIGEDYKHALGKLKDKMLPYDIALVSRLLHTSSKYSIIVIGKEENITESDQDAEWASRSLKTVSDEHLNYPQHPFHKYYAGCHKLGRSGSNVKRYCLPSRILGVLENEISRIISQLMSLSWGAIIVDLDYNADLIYDNINNHMQSGRLGDLDINLDIYSLEGATSTLKHHSQIRTSSSNCNRVSTTKAQRPQNSSFYFTLLMNNDEPISSGESSE